MEIKEQLTNEKIRKRFISQFDLVNYAIKLAENMIMTGRDPRVRTDSHNRSLHVVSEILSGRDYLDEMIEDEEFEEDVVSFEEAGATPATEKGKDRKKSRKSAK